MPTQSIDAIKTLFHSRLSTLEHLLKTAATHFPESEAFLQQRIVADMLPLGTQIAFTCNQPRNFALWCAGQPADNLDPEVTRLTQAYDYIDQTKALVESITLDDSKLAAISEIDLGYGFYIEVSGHAYVDEFLLPNFYFHLVTAYDILRMTGVPLGKRDYMLHLVPFVKQRGT